MIDNDQAGDGAPFARAYDFFKHMTGIALVSIGGVFAFMDNAGTVFETRRAVIILSCLCLSGVTSLIMTNALVTAEVKPVERAKMARNVRIGLAATTFFLAAGLGSFIQTFSSALLK